VVCALGNALDRRLIVGRSYQNGLGVPSWSALKDMSPDRPSLGADAVIIVGMVTVRLSRLCRSRAQRAAASSSRRAEPGVTPRSTVVTAAATIAAPTTQSPVFWLPVRSASQPVM